MRKILLLLLMPLSTFVFSQEEVNVRALNELKEELYLKYSRAQSRSLSSIDYEVPGLYFVGVFDDLPIYITTQDGRQMKSVNAEDLLDENKAPENIVLKASGLKAYIWDTGNVNENHQEFEKRVFNREDAQAAQTDHSTAVAGIIGGAGKVNVTYKDVKIRTIGIASKAELNIYDFNDNMAEIAEQSASSSNSDYLISNHSYGLTTGWSQDANKEWRWYGYPETWNLDESPYFGYYYSIDKELDEIAYNAPQHLMVKATGNDRGEGPSSSISEFWGFTTVDGKAVWKKFNKSEVTKIPKKDCELKDGYDCIPYGNVAKNILLVGSTEPISGEYYTSPNSVNISSFSSFGPTDDGRIKPDLVAPGKDIAIPNTEGTNTYSIGSGTSYSAPLVSGAVLLLQEFYTKKYSKRFLRSDLAKAILIHSANQVGEAGPDYKSGWGLLNALGAVEIISKNGATTYIENITLHNKNYYEIEVVASGDEPLKATIAWLDPPAESGEVNYNDRTPKLVNDLDLRITYENQEFKPWILDVENPSKSATKGDNVLDNVEQVLVENPTPGVTYKIGVTHKKELKNGSQNFALVVSGLQGGPEGNIYESMRFYPNPVANDFYIRSGKNLEKVEILVYTITGQLVFSKKQGLVMGENKIDLSSLEKGVYVFVLEGDDAILRQKLIKK